MVVETTRDNVCVNHIIGQKTENFIVEGDSIIPDIKPDIINAINTNGTICVYKKEITDGKIKIDGSIDTYIMYFADDENNSVRGLNVNLDFSQVIEMEKAMPDMNLETNLKLKSMECKVINGRKVSVKAFIEAKVKVTSKEDIDIINNVNLKEIQMLNENLNINSMIGSGETKVYAKDTLVIDNIDNLSEIMKADLRISNKDIKVSYNKILAKADIKVRLLYLTDDNRINSVEATVPIMGFIDMPDVSEDNICDTKYEIKNLIIKPNNVEEHSIYMEAEIEISCDVYKTQEINIIQDLYSPKANVTFTQKQVNIMQKIETMQGVYNIREKQVIPEIGGNKIYDVGISVDIKKQTILNDRVLFEGELALNYIYSSNSSVETKQTSIPFTYNMDFMGINQNSKLEASVDTGMQDFVITEDGNIDVKVDIIFNLAVTKNTQINIIDDITEDENRSMCTCSLVVYYVKNGDTLWKIAKKFGSTVEEIARINGIENENKLNIAQQLFIPRYNG